MCDFDPNQCMQPPMPGGNGMSITISIDLGGFLNPCPQGPSPSTSLTKMPPPPPPCDEGGTICFLDDGKDKSFKGAKDHLISKMKKDDQKEDGSKKDEECEEE